MTWIYIFFKNDLTSIWLIHMQYNSDAVHQKADENKDYYMAKFYCDFCK